MDELFIIKELKNFLDETGRLKSYPAKFKPKIISLFYLTSKFEPKKRYSEKEVNEILKSWHMFNDWCMLRRDLYDKRFLGREQNSSYYWLEDKQPTFADFGLELLMTKQLVNEQYGLKATNLYRLQMGVGGLTYLVETNSEKYVLKGVSSGDCYVRNEPEIAIFLKKNGLPVAEYVLTKDNQYLWKYDSNVYHMQRFVEGEIIPFNKAPDWFMTESAQLLGKIHAVLSGFKQLPTGMGDSFIDFMQSGYAKASYEKTLEKAKDIHDINIVTDVEYRLSQVDKLQAIEFDLSKFTCSNTHGDYKISQIICQSNHIKAVIDWTGACVHPICWEIIRSFTYADSSCETGEIDIDRFIEYIMEYLLYFSLNAYDLKMMPYYFYYQLLSCDYYGQYYASDNINRGDFLFQAQFATKLIRWFESNVEDLSKRLFAMV